MNRTTTSGPTPNEPRAVRELVGQSVVANERDDFEVAGSAAATDDRTRYRIELIAQRVGSGLTATAVSPHVRLEC